jgi:AraC-like DNA-binding protein
VAPAGRIARLRSWLDAASLVHRVVDAAGTSGSAISADQHPAVRTALYVLPELLAENVRVGALASRTGLSTSRFSHLFNAQVGTSIRAYVRWLRLERAARVFEAGGTLTRAACVAGFSDAAHLTRTFRRMFGLAPSDILGVARWVARPSGRP